MLLSDPRVAAQRPTGCCSATHGFLLSDPRVAAQRPTGCCSATHWLLLSDPRVAAQRPTGCCSATHGLLRSDPRVAAQLVSIKGEWMLHLTSGRAAIKWWVACDSLTYAPFLPYHYAQMSQVPTSNPDVHAEYVKG